MEQSKKSRGELMAAQLKRAEATGAEEFDTAPTPEAAVDALREVATGLARQATEDTPEPAEGDGDTDTEIASRNSSDRQSLRILEARLFAAEKSLTATDLAESLPEDADVPALLAELQAEYAERGVNLVRAGGRWSFRTAGDLSYLLERHAVEERRLSRAALETLAIIAYHQPVTRAEIEEVRGVSTSKGTLDTLMEVGWVRPRGRRRAPGKPITYGTSDDFLAHFGLDSLGDLPGLEELKGAGLLDAALPPGFRVPQPQELAALLPDEMPLEDGDDPEDVEEDLDDADEDDDMNTDTGLKQSAADA